MNLNTMMFAARDFWWRRGGSNEHTQEGSVRSDHLERYYLNKGNYPDALQDLAPGYLEKIPHDGIGGKPMKYHRTDDGRYVLYSIGWDGQDDGGKDNTDWVYEKFDTDWVWPYLPIHQ